MRTTSCLAAVSISSRTFVTSPLKRSTDSTLRWHVASTLAAGIDAMRMLGNCVSCLNVPLIE